jgi:acetoacetyl-CoA synthetase
MVKLLWEPSEERKRTANMTKYIEFVNNRFDLNFNEYFELYDWSVNNLPDFWGSVWDFCEIKSSKGYEKVAEDLNKFPGTNWFPGARLNFAENLLRHRDDHTAFIFKGESEKETRIS